MARNTGSADDRKRRHATATQAAMRQFAKNRQCPACGRKSAMKRIYDGPFVIGSVCRWCKHERKSKDPYPDLKG